MANQTWHPDALVNVVFRDRGDGTHALPIDAAWGASSRPVARTGGILTTGAAVIAIPTGAISAKVVASTLAHMAVGATAALPASAVAEVQTITAGDATSGNFTASFQGQTSGSIAWNSSAANAQIALRAMSSFGATVVCGGGPLNTTSITVTFDTTAFPGDQPLLTVTTVDLAGGASAASRLPVVTETTKGVTALGWVEATTPELFALGHTDAYLFLKAETGTGTYRVSFYS